MGIILIAIGLVFTMIDIDVSTFIEYPQFSIVGDVGSYKLSPSIRTYTVGNILGQNMRIDIFSDVIGLTLLLIGIIMVIKHNKQYFLAFPLWGVAAASLFCLRFSGFFNQGPWLVIWVLVSYYALITAKIFMEYVILYATVISTDVHVNRGTNTRILFCWWIANICRVFITFLRFVGHFRVAYAYQAVLVGISIIVAYNLIKTRKYIGQSKIIRFRDRKLRELKKLDL